MKFATCTGGVSELSACDNQASFEIYSKNKRRVRLSYGQYASDFLANTGDEFYEHNCLLYIKTKEGEVISADNYDWDNTLIQDCYHIFSEMFGNPVKATQIDSHHKIHLVDVA